MSGTKMTDRGNRWNTTDSGIDEPQPLSKEVMQRHAELVLEYTRAANRMGDGRRTSSAVRDAEEVARSNLKAFERIHGLTSSDPRIG